MMAGSSVVATVGAGRRRCGALGPVQRLGVLCMLPRFLQSDSDVQMYQPLPFRNSLLTTRAPSASQPPTAGWSRCRGGDGLEGRGDYEPMLRAGSEDRAAKNRPSL